MGFAGGRAFKITLSGIVALSVLIMTDTAYGWGPPGRGAGLVGRDLNGTTLNGKVLEGLSVVEVSLKQVQLQHRTKRSVKLKRTRFRGINPIGAIFSATLDDGDTLKLRIDNMERSTEPYFRDVFRYMVSFPTQDGWQPLCGLDDDGNPIRAIPLNGRWDLREGVLGGGSHIEDKKVFTFACEGFVIAKCVMAGYKPWGKAWVCNQNGKCRVQSLASHHQACTRLLRADYCGDGTPYTEDGIVINMYDGLGIRIDINQWLFEAEWDANGAVCVVNERIVEQEPDCMEYLRQEECGDMSHLFYGTLLFSEVIHDR